MSDERVRRSTQGSPDRHYSSTASLVRRNRLQLCHRNGGRAAGARRRSLRAQYWELYHRQRYLYSRLHPGAEIVSPEGRAPGAERALRVAVPRWRAKHFQRHFPDPDDYVVGSWPTAVAAADPRPASESPRRLSWWIRPPTQASSGSSAVHSLFPGSRSHRRAGQTRGNRSLEGPVLSPARLSEFRTLRLPSRARQCLPHADCVCRQRVREGRRGSPFPAHRWPWGNRIARRGGQEEPAYGMLVGSHHSRDRHARPAYAETPASRAEPDVLLATHARGDRGSREHRSSPRSARGTKTRIRLLRQFRRA